ncbi:MAG: tRNA (adenosine(37)-N6)-threonylcarbamoyltransferase complex transferase subunit TsaD [Anaerolineae bacterium]
MGRVLGIETSCDETAAAVVEDGYRILSNVIASQVDIHKKYGGVFPEMASREHVLKIMPVIEEAMQEADVGWNDLDAVAVTYGPGLAGSLLVGVNVAKGIAYGQGLPLIGVNHLEGHIYSNWLDRPEGSFAGVGRASPAFPLICLIVSGGHTELVLMSDHGRYQLLGCTLDDAAGEAFDKVGRVLGLGFPGGPAIQEAAERGDPTAFDLPRAWLPGTYDFSFSGLKTAVLRVVREYQEPGSRPRVKGIPVVQDGETVQQLPVADLAASFQTAVVDPLVEKTHQAVAEYGVEQVLMGGGVAANKLLRQQMKARSSVPVLYPPPILCTDNGACIASAGYFKRQAGARSGWDLDVVPNLRLTDL